VSEETNPDVQELVQPVETEAVQETETQESHQPQKGSKEYNFRELEKSLQEERQHRIRLESYVNSIQQQMQQPHQEEPEEDDSSADEYISRKQAEAIASRKAKELLQQQEVASLEDRTRLKYRDYDDVVTDNNIKELIEDDRELVEFLKSSPNPYATAYKLIKKSAFYQGKGIKNNREVEKMIKNQQKPVSSNTVATRPLAGASNFASMSQADRNDLYQEMMEAARRR